ncbi:MAG: ERAP1-like C-terminal domain-containing protein [Acidobacteria bacterium]|nr:ERAP1-like C-terminal domain-containing protein [Acidobacteriota bacterium]
MRFCVPLALGLAALAASPAAAQRLPTTVVPSHYDLAFGVDLAHERFEGTETIQVQVEEATPRVVLHAVDITFRNVTIRTGTGASAQTAQTADVTLDANAQTATLTVGRALEKGPATIQIRYSGILGTSLRGFYISKTKARKHAVTQFESTDARRAFPCFDEPAFKATFAVTLTIDRGDAAISNGRVLSDTPGPAVTQHTMKFATSPKMSSYLLAMAVGDFKCLEGAADAIPIRICATPDKTELGRIALESAEQILKFYNTYYTIKYPFGKLDVVAVPDFAAGAMENTAAIFYRETDLLADSQSASVATRKTIASILAHEMAHQWFGGLVTMQWWDDIWLNEGFATWMANKPLAAAHGDWNIAVDETEENRSALNLDALKATRPIHADVNTPAQIDEAFDGIAYEKGAAVLRMVEHYVGPEAFRAGINAYLQAHAYANAASEDLWKAISASSGKPVERILPTFVNQPGVPLLEVSSVCANDRTTVTLTQRRFFADAASAEAGRWQIPVCLKGAGQSAPTCEVLTDASRAVTLPGTCSPWVFANAGARGYYRTAYSSELLRGIAPRVETDLSAPERLMLLDDEWAMVRARRHTIGDYLTLAAGYGTERTSGVLQEATSRLGFIHTYLTTDATRGSFERFARGLLRPLFSDLGLTAASSDSDERRTLRSTVVAALGSFGDDPDVVAQARTALDRALAGGPALDATTAASVIRTAAAHGDAALFDALASAAERATSPEEQYRYLYALAGFRDPALIDRGLQRVLSTQIRNQDAAIYLGRFFANPAARPRAWTFVNERWAELAPKISISGGDTNLVRSLAGFCDAPSRDAIVSFFAAHPLPASTRTLDQTLEQINSCIELRESQTAAVTSWLAGRS